MEHQNPYDYLSEDGTENFQKDFYGISEEELPFEIEKENRQLAREYLDILSSCNIRKERDNAREEIKNLIRKWGLHYEDNKAHYALSRDEKHIIRMDFYGSINETDKTQAHTRHTQQYLKHIQSNNKPELAAQNYDLSTSPVWKLYRQFPRFRKIENKLKQQLQKMNIPAEMLPQMNAYDFSDVLYNYYYSAETAPKAYMFLGARRSFIKDFIRKNEKKFRQFLKHLDIDDRYSDELVSNMKKYGKTSRVYVIDHKKGAELLKTYQEKGLLNSTEEIQEKLTLEQIEFIRSHGDYTKVAILGKDGKPLSGPEFSVHHKVAVKDAAEVPDLLDVNKFENLCLTIEYPYHRILHSLDSTQTIDRRESYTSRIYMDKDIIFWGGFHQDFHIHYDYRQDERTLRQKKNHERWKEQNPLPETAEYRNISSAHDNSKLSRKQKKQQQKQKAVASVAPKGNENISRPKKIPAPETQEKQSKEKETKQTQTSTTRTVSMKDVIAKAIESQKKKIKNNRQKYQKKILTRKKKEAIASLISAIKQNAQAQKSEQKKEKLINQILLVLNKKARNQ